MSEVGYIAYIDESGDDGIKLVAPGHPESASEFFVMGCALIRIEKHDLITPWINETLNALKLGQRKTIHFADLYPRKRIAVCERLCSLPVRCFTVTSHKVNVSSYTNPRASAVGTAKNRFYPWIARVLMERVSDYCSRDAAHTHGNPKTVRFYFSRRGGIYLHDLKDYLLTLERRDRTTGNYLTKGQLSWDVMRIDEIHISDPVTRPGLQLADIVAGAFYQSFGDVRLNILPDAAAAMKLKRTMALCKDSRYFEYSVKLLPHINALRYKPKERAIFDFYKGLK